MILDTCALLWLASGNTKLSRSALKRINQAPVVCVSAFSGFEIAIKVARGKLKLPSSPQEWFEKVVEHHGLSVLALEWSACIAAAQLPPIHDDPCDRFIIATAKLNDLPVVTEDARFEKDGVTVVTERGGRRGAVRRRWGAGFVTRSSFDQLACCGSQTRAPIVLFGLFRETRPTAG